MAGIHFGESRSKLHSQLPLSKASPQNIRITTVLHSLYKFNPSKTSLYNSLINTSSTTLRRIHHSSIHLTAPSPTRYFFCGILISMKFYFIKVPVCLMYQSFIKLAFESGLIKGLLCRRKQIQMHVPRNGT